MMREEAERHPVATGPWKFVEHIRGDRIVYEAVEHHWRATPHFKRLVFLKVPEPATHMARLWVGSVDVIEIGGGCGGATESRGTDAHHAERVLGLCHPGRTMAHEVHL